MNYNIFFEIVKYLFVTLMLGLVILLGVNIYKTLQEAQQVRIEIKNNGGETR